MIAEDEEGSTVAAGSAFPAEVLQQIFLHLDHHDLCEHVSLVCWFVAAFIQ